jgi:hypothetical protein
MIHNKRTQKRYELIGKYYGYPKCCIDSFIVDTKSTKNPKRTRTQRYVHKGLGFIPCHDCATKIMNGENTIEQLIKNRIYSKPFPNSCMKKKRICKLRALILIYNYYRAKK